jgi:hypothetical protein
MPLQLDNLETRTRAYMIDELDRDIQSGRLYLSRRLSEQGRQDYPGLLRAAMQTGDDASLAAELDAGGRLVSARPRQRKSGAASQWRQCHLQLRKLWPWANSTASTSARSAYARWLTAFRKLKFIEPSGLTKNGRDRWRWSVLASAQQPCSMICGGTSVPKRSWGYRAGPTPASAFACRQFEPRHAPGAVSGSPMSSQRRSCWLATRDWGL